MKIIIAGAGEVGTHLAKMLSQEKQDIILMDPSEERLNITNTNMEILPMVGNPTSIRDLEEARLKKTDLFVSVTPEETTILRQVPGLQAGSTQNSGTYQQLRISVA